MNRRKNPQLELLKKHKSAFGSSLMKKRKGRAGPRPLSTRTTMHLVLRSTKAVKDWSFKRSNNESRITSILEKFSHKYGVKLISVGNAGNHLHIHLKLSNRYAYKAFIRAITAAIAMAVTGASRWNKLKYSAQDRFWDYRPFTRIVESFKAFLNLKDYVEINQLEGQGYSRQQARLMIVAREFSAKGYRSTG